jgi:hypothetical protein
VTVIAIDKPLTHKRSHKPLAKRLLTRRRVARMDGRSATVKLYMGLLREIEADLGGRDQLSRIEQSLIEAFCGAAVIARRALPLKDGGSIDVPAFATAVTAMSRIGSQLGLSRRQKEVLLPSVNQYLRERAEKTEAGG